jgi:DNA topoisomerase-2
MSYDPSEYKHYDHRTHVYLKPDTYIGSDEKIKRNEWIFDESINMIVQRELEIIPGIERIFLEILTNASDNVGRSRRANVDPGIIEIKMDEKRISIKNQGLVIPIKIHQEEKKYIPELIFGMLLTSSNYGKDRHEAGTNGIGAKVVNIFSKKFQVEIADKEAQLSYLQTWENNMTKCSKPIVLKDKDIKESFVKISYLLDFQRFSLESYSEAYFQLFLRHAIDVSFNSKVLVVFNDKEYNFSSILDYGKLYFPFENYLIHRAEGIELIVFDSPNEGEAISFVNSLMTKEGGVHLEAAIKAFSDPVMALVNEEIINKIQRIKKREITSKERRSLLINQKDIRQHISLVLSVRVINPKFNSQSKNFLEAPKIKIKIDKEEVASLSESWKLFTILKSVIELKEKQELAKTDGKLKKYVNLKKGIDANFAGKSRRAECVLYLTEGKSGSTYAEKLIALDQDGRDFIGLLPLKGKSLNVMKAEEMRIENNEEIIELKQMLGLVDGADYLLEENFNKLRYGSVLIMADSDVDGKHIVGLIINFFYCRFVSLLRRGYVMFYRSPIIRAWRKKPYKPENAITFFSEFQYHKWKLETPEYKKWHFKYFKGLGSSSDEEIKNDYQNKKIVECLFDDKCQKCIKLAFDPEMAEQRKEWLSKFRSLHPNADFEEQKLPISKFFKEEFISYIIANLRRCIPSLIDGLKESERKIIFSCFKNWDIGSTSNYESIKVAQIANDTARITNYHHNEEILGKVIAKLSQNFIGSNNLPLLKATSQSGTRYYGGKNSPSARYMFVQPERYFHLIFRVEDFPVLNFLQEEGKSIEPETFFPIVPLALINGACGIATGYSTFIPNFKLEDIVAWLKARIAQRAQDGNAGALVQFPELKPYYKGFTGGLEVIQRDSETEKVSFISYGNYKVLKSGTVIVNELPIQKWPCDYHKLLEELRNKKKIRSFKNNSYDDTVYFEIEGMKEEASYRSLHLMKSLPMSNMVLLIENDIPINFENVEEILEAFFVRRLKFYQKRKDFIIAKMRSNLKNLEYKQKFLKSVLEKKLEIFETSQEEIKQKMELLKIPIEFYENSKVKDFSLEEAMKLQEKIEKARVELEEYEKKDIGEIWIEELNQLCP